MTAEVLDNATFTRRTGTRNMPAGAALAPPGAEQQIGALLRDRLPGGAALCLAFLLSFAADGTGFWQIGHLGVALFDPAQAALIAVLLRSPSSHRTARLAACAFGLFAAGLAGALPWTLAAALALAHVAQAVFAFGCMLLLLRGRSRDVTQTMPCAIMLMCGGVLAPAVGSVIATCATTVMGEVPLAVLWRQDGIPQAVGVLTCLPALLTMRLTHASLGWRSWAALLAVAVGSGLVSNVPNTVLPDLLLPLLVYACFVDFGTAMLCLPLTAVSIAVAIQMGTSPFAMLAAATPVPGLDGAQVLLLTMLVIVLPLALVLEERGRLARISAAALDRAVREGAEKTRFITTLSHEIRTPMNGIIGFTDLLGATGLSAEQAEYVGKTQGAAASLLKMVNDLLDLSKAEAGRMPIRRCAFDLRALCDDVIGVLRATPDAQHIDLSVHVDAGLAARVEGDPMRLRQVLFNLTANALANTHQGSVELEVAPVPCQASHVRFQVRDTGVGIAAERLPELFRPFSQLNDRPLKGRGTGLGLAICKEIVEQMPGGTIGVQSRLGHGSLFWFILSLPEAVQEEVIPS